ncbi:MAG: metallophosphoesterase [Verrucomicrobia bacterium]|nr:metallophosphoesterase [Verrucomicrobiota bacterium]
MSQHPHLLSRRAFVRSGALCLAGVSVGRLLAADPAKKPAFRIGLLTDLHYADKPALRTRFYRETAAKLQEAVRRFNAERPAFVVELGDFIDKAGSVEEEIPWLEKVERVFASVKAPRHYVLGNHCVMTLTKAEFAAHTGASRVPHYSFDHGGFHFVVLDSCFRSDGEAYQRENFDWKDANIPAQQLDWLRADLAKAGKPAIIFAHQRLDEAATHSVRNAAAVREVLERAGNVVAVFQGHSHKNDYQQIAGIHYCTLFAMVEGSGSQNSAYGLLDVMEDGSLRLNGFRKQASRSFERGK